MFDEILSRVFFNQWAVFLIISLLVLVLSEAGFRCGVASRLRNAHSAENIGGSVQGAVWLQLLFVSGCIAWASGAYGVYSLFNPPVFPMAISVFITLTADIDRPTKGLIGVSQKPLAELLNNIQPATP